MVKHDFAGRVVLITGALGGVLAAVDEAGHLLGRPALLVHAQAAHGALDQAQLIVRIQDLKRLGQPGLLEMHAQQAMRDAVERAHPQAARRNPQHGLQSPTHFAGGLVGESDRQNRLRRYAFDANQPGDAVDQHTGLARTGARQNAHMRWRRAHRFTLGIVQTVENFRNIIHGGDCTQTYTLSVQVKLLA